MNEKYNLQTLVVKQAEKMTISDVSELVEFVFHNDVAMRLKVKTVQGEVSLWDILAYKSPDLSNINDVMDQFADSYEAQINQNLVNAAVKEFEK
ncbi:hypothetical protein [Weissella cibaria]|uniref:hypothetical protein n=1 Tax=Weissella cibaria TaxID=137591 RepID=UPI001FF31A41|nr:hypothetical protein [Weissella cibaria]UOX37593.1 hypothetical protein IDM39_04760 [Weissella cibaria]